MHLSGADANGLKLGVIGALPAATRITPIRIGFSLLDTDFNFALHLLVVFVSLFIFSTKKIHFYFSQ